MREASPFYILAQIAFAMCGGARSPLASAESYAPIQILTGSIGDLRSRENLIFSVFVCPRPRPRNLFTGPASHAYI